MLFCTWSYVHIVSSSTLTMVGDARKGCRGDSNTEGTQYLVKTSRSKHVFYLKETNWVHNKLQDKGPPWFWLRHPKKQIYMFAKLWDFGRSNPHLDMVREPSAEVKNTQRLDLLKKNKIMQFIIAKLRNARGDLWAFYNVVSKHAQLHSRPQDTYIRALCQNTTDRVDQQPNKLHIPTVTSNSSSH